MEQASPQVVTDSTAEAAPSTAHPPSLPPEVAARFPVLQSTRFEDILVFEREFDTCVRALRLEEAPSITPCVDPAAVEVWAVLNGKKEDEFP